MNRGRISISVFLCFLMMMLLVVSGCSKNDDPTYSISGKVTAAVGGAAMSGVTMNLTGDVTATTTTAADGTYSFSGIPAGTNGAVIPVKAGYTFDPLSNGGTLTANVTNANFAATLVPAGALAYTISGNVSTAGSVLAGVTITLTGDATGFTVTNASGNYSFPGILLNGNYTVTPSLTGYTFSPTGTGVIISGADSTGINFTATANAATTYSISGTVSGDAVAGVTITLSGGTSGTTITATGTDGTYSFAGLLPGSYTVTASRAGYTFSAALTPTIVAANISGQDFDATMTTANHTIGGTVSGTVAGNVTIYLTGDANATAVTNGSGVYIFTGLAHGVYTVTPVLASYKFAATSLEANITDGSRTGRDFVSSANTALTYSISGTVSGQVVSGVTITLSSTGSPTTTTNATGNYSFSGLVAGSYTVTPTLTGYEITPDSRSVSVSSANVTVPNFVVGTAPAAWSQADLTGTWRMNLLKTGTDTEWDRAEITINSSGVATCLSVDASFSGGNVCPNPFDLKLTMNTSTGVITQTGTNAPNAGTDHMTMTSNKNFIAGTGTNGTTPNFSYQLMIAQKEVSGTSYANDNDNLYNKSIVYHKLSVGNTTTWEYGEGTTDGAGVVTPGNYTDPTGTHVSGSGPGTISVSSAGVVTMSGDTSFQGFLSADKKTIVGTDTPNTGVYSLMIIQVVEVGDHTVGPLPAGISVAHMLGTGTDFAGWIHFTNTVAPGGGMSFSGWADSGFGSSAPSTAYTGNITTTSGTLTITGNDTYHGQISHDGKFTVGTQTNSGFYFLTVTTE